MIHTVFLADAGTPLMWASILYLVFGNLIIGICEGILIGWVFRRNQLFCALVMIPANYFSAWVGAFGLDWLTTIQISPSLYVALPLIILMIFVSYLLSIVLEWPFIMVLFRGQQEWLWRSFKASVLAQTASYAVITPFFFLASPISILTATNIDSHLTQWVDPVARLYFIDTADQEPYSCKLDGTDLQRLSEEKFPGMADRLFVKETPDHQWDLYGLRCKDQDQKGARILIRSAFAKRAATFPDQDPDQSGIGEATDFRPEDQQAMRVFSGCWSADGLELNNQKTNERSHFALETPFLNWPVRFATVLPHDQVIFQLGDQIAILEIKTSKLGMIVRGKGPIVAYP